MKRIAVKIGSNVLTRKDGTLDITRMSALVDQVADLHRQGMEIVLISSGAVASGRSKIKAGKKRASAYYKREFRESYALPEPEALHGGNA